MAQETTDRYAARDAIIARQVAEAEDEIAQWVQERTRQLRMTQAMRAAVDRTARRVFARRRLLFLPGHSPIRQRFLKLMLSFAVAHEPRLMDRLRETARYLSRNYAYEWATSPVTRAARLRAREVILANADSEFGETPVAAAFAYSRHHPEEARVEHVSNYGEVYTRALRLVQDGFFNDGALAARQNLGLEAVAAREKALEEAEHAAAAP